MQKTVVFTSQVTGETQTMTAEDSRFVDSVPVPYKEVDDMCRDKFTRSQGGSVDGGRTHGEEAEELSLAGLVGKITPSKPQWTKEPPTVPGWYWVNEGDRADAYPAYWDNVRRSNLDTWEDLFSKVVEWCGPLTPPV